MSQNRYQHPLIFMTNNQHRLSMSENFQRPSYHDGDGLTKVCIGCLDKDVTFVNLLTCKHFAILENLLCSIPKMEPCCLVCYHCHAKLKSIYEFKLQAEESFNMLWSRQHSAAKRAPKLVKEEIYLECGPQEVLMDMLATKPELNHVEDCHVVVSGCWLNNPHSPPEQNHVNNYEVVVSGSLLNKPHTQTDQNIYVVKIEKQVDEDPEEACVSWNPSSPSTNKISTTVKNYHIKMSGLHLDSPEDNEVPSDLDGYDDEPLTMIKREVEIEAPLLQKHEEAGGAVKRQFANIEDKPAKAEVHTDRVFFHCTECNKKFPHKKSLIAHNSKVHNNHPIKVFKAKSFPSKDFDGVIKQITLTHEELMLERETERNSERYLQRPHRCDLCILSFNYEQVLNDHNKKHQLVANSFQCDICMTVFEAHHVMKNHEKNHYVRYECSVCQKQYSSSKTIVDHYNRLHEAKNKNKYSCSLCDHTSMTYQSHIYHLNKHKGRNLCLLCSSTFSSKTSLRVHMLRVHGKSKEKATVRCKECNKTYSTQNYLTDHIKAIHKPPSADTDVKAYCAPCNQFFKSEYVLQQHLKWHKNHRSEDDKKITCDICNERFFTKAQILAHISWMHLNKRPFPCSQCEKSYETKSRLRKHVRYVHEKIRLPKDKMCHYCGQGFQTPAILRSHIRRHTGERPYQCSHCPSTFAHSGAYHTHHKLLHPGKPKQKISV